MLSYDKCATCNCSNTVHTSELGKHIFCKSHLVGKNIYETINKKYAIDVKQNNLTIAIRIYISDMLVNNGLGIIIEI